MVSFYRIETLSWHLQSSPRDEGPGAGNGIDELLAFLAKAPPSAEANDITRYRSSNSQGHQLILNLSTRGKLSL